MDDAVHVQIQVVEFHAVWVGQRGVDGDVDAADLLRSLLDDLAGYFGIFGR